MHKNTLHPTSVCEDMLSIEYILCSAIFDHHENGPHSVDNRTISSSEIFEIILVSYKTHLFHFQLQAILNMFFEDLTCRQILAIDKLHLFIWFVSA
jgi:hypothetical protein